MSSPFFNLSFAGWYLERDELMKRGKSELSIRVVLIPMTFFFKMPPILPKMLDIGRFLSLCNDPIPHILLQMTPS